MFGKGIAKAVKFAQAKKAGKPAPSSNPVASAVQQAQPAPQIIKTPAQVTAQDIAQEKQQISGVAPVQPVQPIEAQPVEPLAAQEPIPAQMPNPMVSQIQNPQQTITPQARQAIKSFRPSRRFRNLSSLFERRKRF